MNNSLDFNFSCRRMAKAALKHLLLMNHKKGKLSNFSKRQFLGIKKMATFNNNEAIGEVLQMLQVMLS